MSTYYYPEQRIAVVALGGLFPDAINIDNFWNNILSKKVSIREVDDSILDEKVFYRPEVFGKINKNDKSYTRVAALTGIRDYTALTKNYKIPPAVAEHMDPNQHVAVYCIDQALKQLGSSLPKDRTAVILGTGAPGRSYDNILRRSFYARVEHALLNHPELVSGAMRSQLEEIVKQVSGEVLKDTLPITEDSAPGMLQNINAARIANILDFWGPSYTVDAACASALAAVSAGVAGLLDGSFDAVITGAVEVTLSELSFVVFSGINALSPDGSYPFDSRANGFVMGLGGGVLVLKRLEDALRDGDNIISVISGYGQGSDGKGKYIAAPSEEGQVRVIQNACKMAGYSVDTIEMVEAHGTGTIVGDVVEVGALKKAFQSLGATKQGFCGLGSVKSNIGHLRYAAGVPGLIKASLALQKKILPPTANIQSINPKLKLEGSPFYILTGKKPWKATGEHPRRANVSAYGFGGADYHICLEEFRSEFVRKVYPGAMPCEEKTCGNTVLEKRSGEEAVFFSGDSFEEVQKAVTAFVASQPAGISFTEAVYKNNASTPASRDWRFAICAHSMDELKDKWELVEQFEREGKLDNAPMLELKGIFTGRGPAVTPDKIAWMFPGQASQYPNMLKSIYENYPTVKSFYHQADAIWKAYYGYSVLPLIFGNDEERLNAELKNTKNTHPAMFLSNIALYRLLSEAGLKADYMIGHSLGEITSLYAGQMIDLKTAVRLVGARGYAFDRIPEAERGKMAVVKAEKARTAELIRQGGFSISIANVNSPDQTVVGGEAEELRRFSAFLEQQGIKYKELNVSHAFHTDIVANASESFGAELTGLTFHAPQAKIMACHQVDFYPVRPEELQAMLGLLKDQMVSPVNFVDSVRKLYEEGVRVFVEAGPSSVLTGLVKQILADADVKIIASNYKNKDSVEAYKRALAELFTCGIELSMVPESQGPCIVEAKAQAVAATGTTAAQAESIVVQPVPAPIRQTKERIVYSGVSVGLPGSFKKAFADDNFKLIFEGRNLIEMLTDSERERMLDLNISRLVKSEEATTIKSVSSINEVIQLAGKFGQLDMLNDYLVDEKTLSQMVDTVCAGVAAGYEALRDAGIPLVREYKKTASGASLPGRLLLPESMRDDTGVLYANGLFPIETVIKEVSKYVASKFGTKTRNDLINFYEAVISRVSDSGTRKLLSDWFTLYYSRLSDSPGEAGMYEFNHNFMHLLYSNANNRLAQFIGAEGPNLFLSAACSSTASAVSVAEDMIRAGRAARMIVVGCDLTADKDTLPWVGGGFLSMGAATDSSNLFEAAVPFDNRRNGMILGSGAVGLVIEKEEDVVARGMHGICRVLGTHLFNCAGHQSKIEKNKYCIELDRFLTKMEGEHRLDRSGIASKTVYSSHETYSPKKGGCSETEKAALEYAFGAKYRELKVINTKGMTGHTLGASLEEAIAAKSLQYQRIPPVANYREPDPALEGLNLSQGGDYSFEYVLRTVIAFGGQGNYHLLQKVAQGDERVFDQGAYEAWLKKVTNSQNVKLGYSGRLLVAQTDRSDESGPIEHTVEEKVEIAPREMPRREEKAVAKSNFANISEDILEIYSQITKYPKDMLDLSMELEADLGVDTVKQATIFSILADKYGLSPEEGRLLSNYPTIGHVVDRISQIVMNAGDHPASTAAEAKTGTKPVEAAFEYYERETYRIISEVTKYPVDMLDKDMEMEADLGIDTVKQATILSMLGQELGLSEDMTANMSGPRTIGALLEYIRENAAGRLEKPAVIPESSADESKKQSDEIPRVQTAKTGNIAQQVLELISQITKYPVEILEEGMELEADLGIDTIKQATVFSVISDEFGLKQEEGLDVSRYKTIGAVIGMVEEALKGAAEESAAAVQPVQESEAVEQDDGSLPEEGLCVQLPVFVEEETERKDFSLNGKNLWVIGDDAATVKSVSTFFERFSCTVREFVFECCDIPAFEEKAAAFVQAPVDAVIDCTGLGSVCEYDRLSGSEEQKMLFLSSEARFLFYRQLSRIVAEPALRIVCAVSADGCHGFSAEGQRIANPFFGAVCGFYKGLGKEWRKSKVKVVDLGLSEDGQLPKEAFTWLADELETASEACEIGYAAGKRMVSKVDYFDCAHTRKVELPEKAHFLVTGGGYGIASEILIRLAQRKKYSFTILGRTRLPEDIQVLASLSEEQLEGKKAEIQNTLKKSGQKPTPVLIQKEFEKLQRMIGVYKTIEAIRANGNNVCYLDCDIRDYESMKAALEKAVEANGAVHAVVHAAGIEKSKLISQKTPEEFQEVFYVKAKGLCNLYRLLDKKELRLVIGFSSISGRFGNEAQLDYCAANNFIGAFMHMFRGQNSQIRTLSIAWSGWQDVGMAWRNEFVKTHAEEMGINLIEPRRGADAFIHLLADFPEVNEIVVSKGIHRFITAKMLKDHPVETPQIDWVTKKDGRIERVHKVLSVKRDPIVNHHRLGTTPLMPAVGFMEICAEFHSLVFGSREQYCFRNIQLYRPLKLFYEKSQEVIMVPYASREAEAFDVGFYTYPKVMYGTPELVHLNSMQIDTSPGEHASLMRLLNIDDSGMKCMTLKEVFSSESWKSGHSIQLGPLFNDAYCMENNLFKFDGHHAIYTVFMSEEQVTDRKYNLPNQRVNPAFMDSMYQVCGIHTGMTTNRTYLPWEIEEFGVLQVPKELGCYKVYAEVKQGEDDIMMYDAIMVNARGEVCYYVKNAIMRRISA